MMEDESSNDVIAMESEESQISTMQSNRNTKALAEKPLMQFFKRLILNKHSQNTVLTNAQLEDILKKEFDFDFQTLHSVEIEIYVTILKKYLKDWPKWDEFETTTKDLTGNYDEAVFVKVLEKRYNSLKSYLKVNLSMAKELSADLVAKVKEAEKSKPKAPAAEEATSSNPSSVALEIKATRDQLNKLIYRQPHKGFNNTIFNVEDKIPSHIKIMSFSLESILNWWSVKIKIMLQTTQVFLTRETTHELQHWLVNRKRKETAPLVVLNEQVQIKETKKPRQVNRKHIDACLDLLSSKHNAQIEDMDVILQCIKTDLTPMKVIVAPASYRRYMSKHPYVRYLYSEADEVNEADKAKYDIQLKECISPRFQIFMGRLEFSKENKLPDRWLEVECMSCAASFCGETLVTQLKEHFDMYHQAEADWTCTRCEKTFPMVDLAAARWRHMCHTSDK